jgi:hypothetical protein
MNNNFNLKQFLVEGKLLNEIKVNKPKTTSNTITIRATEYGFSTFITGYEITIMEGSSKDKVLFYLNEDDIMDEVPEDIMAKLNELNIPFYLYNEDDGESISSTEFDSIEDAPEEFQDFMSVQIEVEKRYCKLSPKYQDKFDNL